MQKFVEEISRHLTEKIIPFWEGIKDEEQGGYYGYMGYDLAVDKTYEKGCILNSRILWFFSNAYLLLGEEHLREHARHAYCFLREHCLDPEYGGVYWSVTCDGQRKDSTKHTYNQAFAIYALASYYDAAGDRDALELAYELQNLIEEKCTDAWGYLEAFNRRFEPEDNEKLSENGVLAEKTMNTLLHVFEAYTELYRVSPDERTKECLCRMLDTVETKVYNRELGRQEVFFDRQWNSLLDLYSYGHDIEAAWLLDRGLSILQDSVYTKKIAPITAEIAKNIYERAFVENSLLNEAENKIPDTTRVWWVQAETIVGFLNEYQKHGDEKYRKAAEAVWGYIQSYLIDPREGSEWFWAVDVKGNPLEKPIVEPWKCPYHNGRMCMEILRRFG